MIKLSITIKDEKSKLTEHELIYEDMRLSKDNPHLAGKVRDLVEKFGLDPDDDSPKITVKATLDWQN